MGQQAGGAPPAISAVVADPDDDNFVGQVNYSNTFKLIRSDNSKNFIVMSVR